MNRKICRHCGKNLLLRHQYIFCSNRCQADASYTKFIAEWKQGRADGNIGISTESISGHIRKYMHETYGGRCGLCGWNKRHPKSGRVPLEIDHIDGNSRNNTESNLRLICANCHSLTINYKNFNKGNGRAWRKEKYIKN